MLKMLASANTQQRTSLAMLQDTVTNLRSKKLKHGSARFCNEQKYL